MYEANIVVFGGCFAADPYGRMWTERGVVLAPQEWNGCYATRQRRWIFASDDESVIIAAGHDDIAIDDSFGINALRHVEAGCRACNAGHETAC